jgi:hypothetical protein
VVAAAPLVLAGNSTAAVISFIVPGKQAGDGAAAVALIRFAAAS